MSLPLFPDVNVWVALNFDEHAHHRAANDWYKSVPPTTTLIFCRQTQLGLFRILTTAAVMGEKLLTQSMCWDIYDTWIGTGQVVWADEPPSIEPALRLLTASDKSSPKAWMDAYLAAFSKEVSLTLVTFDRALASKTKGSLLLA